MDLFVQALMTGCLKDIFRAALVAIIVYLRRQYTLRQQMGCTFPAIFTTSWSYLGGGTRWLVRNRDHISSYIERKINLSIRAYSGGPLPQQLRHSWTHLFTLWVYSGEGDHIGGVGRALQQRSYFFDVFGWSMWAIGWGESVDCRR